MENNQKAFNLEKIIKEREKRIKNQKKLRNEGFFDKVFNKDNHKD